MKKGVLLFLIFTSSLFLFLFFLSKSDKPLYVDATPHSGKFTEERHINFSKNKCSIYETDVGNSIATATHDRFPGYSTDVITQTYQTRTVYWSRPSYPKEDGGHTHGPKSYSKGSWSTRTTSQPCVMVQSNQITSKSGRLNGKDAGKKGVIRHETYFKDPKGWRGGIYGNFSGGEYADGRPPSIQNSDTKVGYSTWVVEVPLLYFNNYEGSLFTYEYQPPALPYCQKVYGNGDVKPCTFDGNDWNNQGKKPGFYSQIVEGGLWDTHVKLFYQYEDKYTGVYNETTGDNYTTRWWLRDVAIEGTSKYAGIDLINPFTYPANHWHIYGGEKRQFKCYAYFYTDPRDSDVQERIDITNTTHTWRTNRTGVQGQFPAYANKPNESHDYFSTDTRWIGNGRYGVHYKTPRADNPSLYWHWSQDPSRVLAPAEIYKENDRENTSRTFPLENRGQYYMLDVNYNGSQSLNCDYDISWYNSGNIPYMLNPITAYRDLTLNHSNHQRKIKQDKQPLTIHGVKDVDLLISGTFYKHTNKNEKGTDQMIVYNRKTNTVNNDIYGNNKLPGVGEYHAEPLRIENPSKGAVPPELQNLYFLKGHWYSFEIEVEYHDGTKRLLNGLPEAHWTVDPWIKGHNKYKKGLNSQHETLRTMMPYNGLEHQIGHVGIHNLHFEWFDKVNPKNGITNFDIQFKAAEIVSLDIYNEKNNLGPTYLNTGDKHQFRALVTFDAGNGVTFQYDWTDYMNIWSVDDYTVKRLDKPGYFEFPRNEGIYGEHQRAGSEAERAERVIFAVWFDDILNYINYTNRKEQEINTMNIYNVAQNWDAFGDMHIVKLKDDCKNIEIYVEKCELPKNSWRINIKDLTPENFVPDQPERYGENPYFLSFEFPVTGTSNGIGNQ